VRNLRILAVALALVLVAASCGDDDESTSPTTAASASGTSTTAGSTVTTVAGDVVLDPAKNYGNKYANGILPVGDSKYVTTGATAGSIYLCRAPGGGGGAGSRGPWFSSDGKTYDMNKKVSVSGEVKWEGSMTMTIADGKRVIKTNDLPKDHTTGVFPVASSDPAYQYDRNPNSIKSQSLTYTVNASPTRLSTPACMGGEVGVMTTGVSLFNAFDAGGRDAGAWETQDGCEGHPQMSGQYHYHTLSSCIADVGVSKVIGYALDGYPITGPKVGEGNILTTSDLDVCHGLTSEVELDGKKVTTYHYVMTQDFPYSASCFRAEAARAPGIP
jgi:hypothetical protein